jgi:hypothetical protein
MKNLLFLFLLLITSKFFVNAQQKLTINYDEYFEMPGLNVMVFYDIYPEGHQGAIGIIQNGTRVATNGDIRLEPTPGQSGKEKFILKTTKFVSDVRFRMKAEMQKGLTQSITPI